MTRPVVTYDELCQLVDGYEELAKAQGLLVRADIAELEITVRTIDATPRRGRILSELAFQIQTQDDKAAPLVGCRAHHPDLGLCRTADLLVVTEDALDGQSDDFAVFGPEVSIAIEVSSADDGHAAPPVYGRMGVPAYAHIDPRNATITVHDGPTRTYKFGDAVRLNDWTIDTSKFPTC
ncbi:hypothetical protein [Streptomyces sp. Da 82-17]|uniref:hypothetical protein n=1 Tax=Streptomyces sp. Da 82-17 TaxID=3377116 RepID=UPI0038D4D453